LAKSIYLDFVGFGTWRSSAPLVKRDENPRSEQSSERDPVAHIMSYWVYILESKRNHQYYVGQTDDVADRLSRHNKGKVISTKPFIPWVLVYSEDFRTRSEAVKREREIKARKSRKYIESLISRDVAQPG
jgi:putative endonuclease